MPERRWIEEAVKTYTAETALQNLSVKTTANFFIHTVEQGITASTTQSQGAGPLTKEINEVSTVASANDTVTLPTAEAGISLVIVNNGTETLQVFPASADSIDGQSVNTSITMTSGERRTFWSLDATSWMSGA